MCLKLKRDQELTVVPNPDQSVKQVRKEDRQQGFRVVNCVGVCMGFRKSLPVLPDFDYKLVIGPCTLVYTLVDFQAKAV